jgi:hypothetical protein
MAKRKTYKMEQAEDDLRDYLNAMANNDINTCRYLEQYYDVSGYPPPICTVVMNTIAQGKSVNKYFRDIGL